jgi:hypothetical protein
MTVAEISIPEISGLDVAFGTTKGLPPYDSLPEEFRGGRTPWNKMFGAMFFRGLPGLEVVPNEGVDKSAALAHIQALSNSWAPKHEHKEAGVAYLMSRYFKSAKWDGGSAA